MKDSTVQQLFVSVKDTTNYSDCLLGSFQMFLKLPLAYSKNISFFIVITAFIQHFLMNSKKPSIICYSSEMLIEV